jgi:N-acetylglucosaminyl-diphospho-decaprenol L-rhamnosyltransferase
MASCAGGDAAAAARRAPMPELSVVIVTWNSGTTLDRCLRSLAEHPPSRPWEVILVDNGSGDGSVERAQADHPNVRAIINHRNRGLAAANNQGMFASPAPFVLISNPDVIYTLGAVDALLDLMQRRPRAAFAVARHRLPDGRLQVAAGDLPKLGEALVGMRAGRRRGNVRERGMWWHGWAHDEERTIGHGAEACYLVRREAVAQIGGQDERYVLDWEGFDWAARAGDAGWEVWFCPAAEVVHLGGGAGASIRQATVRWIVSSHRGMYQYFLDRRALPRPMLAALFAVRAGVKLAATAFGVRWHEGDETA